MNQLEAVAKALAPNVVHARASVTQAIAAAVVARQDCPNAVDIEQVTRQADEFARRIVETQLAMPDAEDWAADQIMKNMDPEQVAQLLGEETKQ